MKTRIPNTRYTHTYTLIIYNVCYTHPPCGAPPEALQMGQRTKRQLTKLLLIGTSRIKLQRTRRPRPMHRAVPWTCSADAKAVADTADAAAKASVDAATASQKVAASLSGGGKEQVNAAQRDAQQSVSSNLALLLAMTLAHVVTRSYS